MKPNREIRAEAWRIVRGKWFGRILTAGVALYTIVIAVSVALSAAFSDMGVQTWFDFLKSKARNMQEGLGYAVPSAAAFWQMTGASAFEQFIGCVFGSILVFGMAGLMLKAVRDDEGRWLADSFGGFKRPLEVTWLMVLMNLKVFLWSLLFIVPGIVAVYRYRQAWYLKNEHPDWSASKCIAESGRLMRGHKGQAFALDCTYAGWLLLGWMVFTASAIFAVTEYESSAALAFVGMLASLTGLLFAAFVLAYFFVGRAVFYREVACAREGNLV